MRSVSVVLLLVVVAMASTASTSPAKEKIHYDINNAAALFEEFIIKNNRQYKDTADRDVHFHAFVESLKKINKLNEGDSGATYGINKFADYTEEEQKSMFGLRKKTKD